MLRIDVQRQATSGPDFILQFTLCHLQSFHSLEQDLLLPPILWFSSSSLFCSFYSSLSSVPSITVDKKGSYTIYIYIHNIHSHLVILIKKGQIWIEIREIVFNLEVLSYTNIHTHLLLLICCKKGIFCSKIDHCDEYWTNFTYIVYRLKSWQT